MRLPKILVLGEGEKGWTGRVKVPHDRRLDRLALARPRRAEGLAQQRLLPLLCGAELRDDARLGC